MKKIIAVIALMMGGAVFSSFANMDKVKLATVQLNDTVKKADTKALLPTVSKLLKVNQSIAEKVLLNSDLTLGDFACMTLLSEKSGKSIDEILAANPAHDWTKAMEAINLTAEEVASYLDSLNTEFAFAALDARKKKR